MSSTSMQMNQNTFFSSKQSTTSMQSEFQPVHTTPDPLTGRYADGRITPNHGYTRNFASNAGPPTPTPVRHADPDNYGSGGVIPTRPDELLHNLGEQIEQRELEQINQNERVTVEKMKMDQNRNNYTDMHQPTVSKPGPPVFYPTEEMYSTQHRQVAGGGGGGSASASASAAKASSSSKKESSENGGAAVIPICLPLCCAAPCVIM